MNVLVAGASGALGYEVVQTLKQAGHRVRTLSRSEKNAAKLRGVADEVVLADASQPAQLTGVCDGIDVVFSSLGASVSSASLERKSFSEVDAAVNRNLLAEAQRAGVKRFVYVAVFVQPGYAQVRYIQAHEAFVTALKASGLETSIVRPTGFFSAMEEFLPMAKLGVMPLIGGGTARSNPIHTQDLALACREAVEGGAPEVPVGGPETLTRRQIGELAFAAVGKKPRFIPVPAFLFRVMASVLRILHPRLGELIEFVGAVSVTDCVAPAYGSLRLGDYYRSVVQRPGLPENRV